LTSILYSTQVGWKNGYKTAITRFPSVIVPLALPE